MLKKRILYVFIVVCLIFIAYILCYIFLSDSNTLFFLNDVTNNPVISDNWEGDSKVEDKSKPKISGKNLQSLNQKYNNFKIDNSVLILILIIIILPFLGIFVYWLWSFLNYCSISYDNFIIINRNLRRITELLDSNNMTLQLINNKLMDILDRKQDDLEDN